MAKPKKKNLFRARIFVGAVIAAACILTIGIIGGWFSGNTAPDDMRRVYDLKKHVFSKPIQEKIKTELQSVYTRDDFIVFLSLCDTKERAKVVKGVGSTLEEAWAAAEENAGEAIAHFDLDVVWAKADIVTATEEIHTTQTK